VVITGENNWPTDINQPTESSSIVNNYLDGNTNSKFDTHHMWPESRGRSSLLHFEHAANVITVVNAQLRVIQSGMKVCTK